MAIYFPNSELGEVGGETWRITSSFQGDNTGSKLDAGSGQVRTVAWDSGELVFQTRNCAFGLVFVGTYDIEGSTSQQTIPASLRGWWLMEL